MQAFLFTWLVPGLKGWGLPWVPPLSSLCLSGCLHTAASGWLTSCMWGPWACVPGSDHHPLQPVPSWVPHPAALAEPAERLVAAGTGTEEHPSPHFPHSSPPKTSCLEKASCGECQPCSDGYCKTALWKDGSCGERLTCLSAAPPPGDPTSCGLSLEAGVTQGSLACHPIAPGQGSWTTLRVGSRSWDEGGVSGPPVFLVPTQYMVLSEVPCGPLLLSEAESPSPPYPQPYAAWRPSF